MRHLLLASSCLVAVTAPLHAETKIETTTTGPVRTSTIKAGTPDDILITSAGTVSSTGNRAVTIDSNHRLINQGKILIGGVLNAIGVDVAAGVTGGITNSGSIIIDESYTPTDADNDGDLDGSFALGSGRVGIRTNGAFIGNIVNSGTITVEGNDSFGILLGGPLTGNFVHDGTTSIVGNGSTAISMVDVTGNVRLAGTITAKGQGAIAVRSAGDVTGAMVLQGNITATGYRSITAPADTTKLDADDLLQGGPAVSIEGDVTKGIIVAVPPKDQSTTNTDEDNDGIEDSKEGSANITSYGSAAALRIGSASAISIGATAGTGTGFGLIVEGTVFGDGLYAGVDGNALQIGGLGGPVAIANGIGNSGTIRANSLDKAATAIRLGAGVSTPELRNAGKITATSGNKATSTATAIDVAAGATLPILRNSGEIRASVGGTDGTAVAIVDKSGTLGLIENSGTISATGAAAASDRNVAIDVSATPSGVTVKQTAVAATFAAPAIVGDIRFGTGSDILDIADGKLTGNVHFGTGNNRFALSGDAVSEGKLTFGSGADVITAAGTSIFKGSVDFGGGSDSLTIGDSSSFTAQLSNAAGLAVTVNKGSFGVVKAATIGSLAVTNGGTLNLLLDKTAGASSSLTVIGAASFDTGSKINLNVANVAEAEGHFVVLTAGTLTGGSNLVATTTLLPFLYNGALSVTGNQVAVNITRKTAAQLGLNKSESAAYSAIYTAIGSDSQIGKSFLGLRDQEGFVDTIQQMLPEHAGGAFEAVTMGDRTAARTLTDPKAPYADIGRVAFWASQIGWGSSKSIGDTAGYTVGGWGITAGADVLTPVGKFGASVNYLWGKDSDRSTENEVSASQYSLAAHWRLQRDGLQLSARGGYAHIAFDGDRFFQSNASGTLVERTIKGDWNGSLLSGSANASQEWWAGSLFVRPSLGLEYYRLNEDGYQEEGGGTALDLTVDKRTSDELAVNAVVTAGFELGATSADEGFFRLELEAGRRQIVGGSLGNTTARFKNGQPFVLEPEDRKSGWVGRLRGVGGNSGFNVAGEVGAEERESRLGLTARASLTLGI